MRQLSGEFGNQYRVGQLLPYHATALRARAEARAVVAQARGAVRIRFEGDEKLKKALRELSQEEDPLAGNRAKIFAPNKR